MMFHLPATRSGRVSHLCGICVFVTYGLMAQQKIPQVPKCQTFKGKTPQAALAYLRQERTTLDPACIYDAIVILRAYRYKPAIPILVQYLDFKNPDAEIAHIARVGATTNFYPAADALGSVGDSVIPDMHRVITSEDANKNKPAECGERVLVASAEALYDCIHRKGRPRDRGPRYGDALAGLAAKMVN
jgi:hypothetical protein